MAGKQTPTGQDFNASHSQEGLPFSAADLLLLNGFSASALGSLIGVTGRTVRARQRALRANGAQPPDVVLLTSQAALQLAQRRGGAQLPHCARVAILDYRRTGYSRPVLAKLFKCSVSTIARVLAHRSWRYPDNLNEGRLTRSQRRPPAAGRGNRIIKKSS